MSVVINRPTKREDTNKHAKYKDKVELSLEMLEELSLRGTQLKVSPERLNLKSRLRDST